MSQIEELQSRISAAMDRIGAGVEVLGTARPGAAPEADAGAGDAGAEPDPALLEALEEEKMANAQLEERLKRLKSRHEEELAGLRESGGEADGEELAALRAELEELRARTEAPSETGGEDADGDLRAQLAEANAALAAAEAARAALEAERQEGDEADQLRQEIATLYEQLDGVEDPAPLHDEIATLKAQLETVEDPAPLHEEITALCARAEAREAEAGALRDELEATRARLADTERLEDLNAELEMLRAERLSHGEAMTRLDMDLQRLRKASAQLREVNEALREANAAGLADPGLIDSGLQAELEALRAVRATDAAEAQAVLSRLEPLLAQANLPEGEDE
ncbi:hypothetical protein SAMN05444007_103192 [Cribrihabitans marinus]|uniref:Uncharacterized protein n=1 Tax=Cribrihabitans marinus TaxID=1227549 RepID=A0A1H6VU68_9RHOB|nr:hypothetical protein [Cribrihabitans marinus]GGH25718.1 hypothetical protein GCM10010973_13050 [Cribrihabitans marinus]SEJ04150.1 hypothetical protein SAMN05444007_103192 [Cribrihabitans marinus]